MPGYIRRENVDGLWISRWVEDSDPTLPQRPNPSVASHWERPDPALWKIQLAGLAFFAPVGLVIGLVFGAWEPMVAILILGAWLVPFTAWLEHEPRRDR